MKCIFTLTLILLSFVVFSQRIDGIGQFKIDKTTIKIISDIEKEIKYDCEITNEIDFQLDKRQGFSFKEIILDSSDLRLFYLSEYVVNGIKLFNIYLFFYNDYLIQFLCDRNKDVSLSFTHKYGRPIIEQRTIPINNTKLNLNYDEHISKHTWIGINNIIAISYEKKQVFDGVYREVDSYFKVYDRTYSALINKININ